MIRPNLFKDSSVDVAIITILDEEYKAVLDQFDNHKHDSGTPESRNLFAWELGELVCGPAKASYSIVLALARGVQELKTVRWPPIRLSKDGTHDMFFS